MEVIMKREFQCPVEATISVIGGKYKAVIIYHLISKVLRFSELQRLVYHATPKMLTQQLRELERDGVIHRMVYPVVPPKVEYSLTPKGETMIPIIKSMYKWGIDMM